MDNDEYRRGRKTTHVVYGPGMATLTGDALLNYAFEICLEACVSCDASKRDAGLKSALILSKKAGIYGMIGGQVVDVSLTGHTPTLDQISYINKLKTSALIESALMIGACLAGASDKDIHEMEKVGSYVGLAFQIQDDILDIESTTQELGKPVHSDEKNDKTTYVTLLGIQKAKSSVESYSKEAIDIVNKLYEDSRNDETFLSELINRLITRRK